MVVDGVLTYTWLEYEVANGNNTGDFDATRAGLSLGVYNQFNFNGMVIEPHARFSIASENQESYEDDAGNKISSREVTAGRISLTPRVYFLGLDRATVPWFSVGLDYDYSNVDDTVSGAPNIDDALSASIGFGLTHTGDFGSLSFDMDARGLGSEEYTSVGAEIRFSYSF